MRSIDADELKNGIKQQFCLACSSVYPNERCGACDTAECLRYIDNSLTIEYLYKYYKSKTPKTTRYYLHSDDDELLFEARQTEEQVRMCIKQLNKYSEFYIYVVRQSEEAD